MSSEVPEQFRPRLCHVVKWPDFQGYGFNLCAEKGKSGQFIGKIDEKSPAEAAGLKEGDRIVEVNHVNIGNENHQQVVSRIKSGGEDTRLLVVDAEADHWYKENKKAVRGDLPEVRFLSAKPEDDLSGHGRVNGDDEHVKNIQSELEKIEVSTISAPVHNGNAFSEDNLHRPRLCHLRFWPHFEGYGFNLHAEKDKPGQYIGLVDNNSPASTGGLKVNDRIIEVNGYNVEKDKHPQVIARIKTHHGETTLLVVDKETDKYYQKKGVTISSSMPQTEHITTPVTAVDPPAKNRHHDYDEVKIDGGQSDMLQVSHGIDLDDEQTAGGRKEEGRGSTSVGFEHKVKAALVEGHQKSEDALHEVGLETLASPENKHQTITTSYSHHDSSLASTAKGDDNLELNLSVAEMKDRLKSKKRQDPRTTKVPFDQKYKDFQRM